jgi:hypothetical protein
VYLAEIQNIFNQLKELPGARGDCGDEFLLLAVQVCVLHQVSGSDDAAQRGPDFMRHFSQEAGARILYLPLLCLPLNLFRVPHINHPVVNLLLISLLTMVIIVVLIGNLDNGHQECHGPAGCQNHGAFVNITAPLLLVMETAPSGSDPAQVVWVDNVGQPGDRLCVGPEGSDRVTEIVNGKLVGIDNGAVGTAQNDAVLAHVECSLKDSNTRPLYLSTSQLFNVG